MGKMKRVFYAGLITAYTALLGTGVYGLVWERMQPEQHIRQAKVLSIKQNSYISDLYWSTRSVTVHIDKEKKPVRFTSTDWNKNLKEGDIVDLVIKPSFAPPGLEGKFKGVSVQKGG
ncbi:MAG: hypothetical protein ABIH63_02775 [archaeon]